MSRAPWLPEGLEEGLQDFIDEAKPQITRRYFETRLASYLKTQNLPSPSPEIIKKLFQKAFYFLKQRRALGRMRQIVESSSRKKRMRAIEKLIHKRPIAKQLQAFETCVKGLDNDKFAFIAGRLRAVRRELVPVRAAVRKLDEELRLLSSILKSDRIVVSGWLKPDPESQFMFEINNYLKRMMGHLKVEDRVLIVTGCALAAQLLPASAAEKDLFDVVYSRIRRAAQSYRRGAPRD